MILTRDALLKEIADGRIRIDYHTANGGLPFGAVGTQTFIEGLAAPDPGHSALYMQ